MKNYKKIYLCIQFVPFFSLTIWRKTRANSPPSCFWWRISISFTWEHDIFSHFYCGVFGGSSEIRWTLKGKSFIIVRASCLVHLVRTYTRCAVSFGFWSNNNMYLHKCLCMFCKVSKLLGLFFLQKSGSF